MSRVGEALRGLAADLGPVRRHADFRRLFTATTVSGFGAAVTMVAAPLQVQRLTGSTTDVGLIGLVELGPLLVVGLWGGALADHLDRRIIAVFAQAALVVCSAALLVNAAAGRRLWVVYAVAAAAAAAWAVWRPAVESAVPRLVPAADLAPAAALGGFAGSASQIAGPALGGLLAAADLTAAYAVDTVAGAAALVLLTRITALPPPGDREEGDQHPLGLGAIVEGLRFAVARRELLGTYLVDITAMLLAFPDALYPFLAVRLHHPHALGLLYASAGIGAVLASASSGWVGRVRRLGLAVAVCAATWGAAIGLAGLAPGIVLVVVALVVAGGADMLSGIFRSTLWNRTVPDELRGRLAGIELLSYSSGPSLGGARAGLTASVIGVRAAIASGGIACVLGVGIVTALLPAFRNHRIGGPGQ